MSRPPSIRHRPRCPPSRKFPPAASWWTRPTAISRLRSSPALTGADGWNGACPRAIRRAKRTTNRPPSAKLPRKQASKATSWHRWAASTTGSPSADTACIRQCTTTCCVPPAASSPSRTIPTRKPWTWPGSPSRSSHGSFPFPMNGASPTSHGKSCPNIFERPLQRASRPWLPAALRH